MNRSVKFALLALVATPLVAVAAEEKKETLSCVTGITYSQEFLATYPKAPAACREIVVKDGKKWIHFVGEVTGVKGNEVSVSFKNVAGDSLGEVTFAPPAEAQLKMEGKMVKYSSLQRGQDLDFYMPEDRYKFYADPGAATLVELPIVKRAPAK